MTDTLLASTDIEEALSLAYVAAIAGRAGYVVAQRNFDRDGIDLTIEAGGHVRPKLDLQLKATVSLKTDRDPVPYSLKVRNYELLRIPTQTPRILVVLDLPSDENQWMSVSTSQLILRHSAYWLSLRDFPETDVTTEKTVYIPKANQFDVPGLTRLMELSRTGKIA